MAGRSLSARLCSHLPDESPPTLHSTHTHTGTVTGSSSRPAMDYLVLHGQNVGAEASPAAGNSSADTAAATPAQAGPAQRQAAQALPSRDAIQGAATADASASVPSVLAGVPSAGQLGCADRTACAVEAAAPRDAEGTAAAAAVRDYDAMIDAMVASGVFEGPVVMRPKFGGIAAQLRHMERQRRTAAAAHGKGRRSMDAAPGRCASLHLQESAGNECGSSPGRAAAAAGQQPATGAVMPAAAGVAVQAAELRLGSAGDSGAAPSGRYISPFAAVATDHGASSWVPRALGERGVPAAVPESDCAARTGSQEASRAQPTICCTPADEAKVACTKQTAPAAELAAQKGKAAVHSSKAQRYAQETLSQCFTDPQMEANFFAWHAHNSHSVEVMSSVIMAMVIIGVAAAQPQLLLLRQPWGVGIGLVTHVTRFSLAVWLSPWYKKNWETVNGICFIATIFQSLRVTLWAFATVADMEQYDSVSAHVRLAGGEAMLLLPFLMQVRFHKYCALHALSTGICLRSLPEIGAALESSAPYWTQASFVQFGCILHCTLALLVPLASVRLLMRSQRQLFIHSDANQKLWACVPANRKLVSKGSQL